MTLYKDKTLLLYALLAVFVILLIGGMILLLGPHADTLFSFEMPEIKGFGLPSAAPSGTP